MENRTWSTLFLVTLITSSQTSFSIVGLPLYASQAGFGPAQLGALLGAFPLSAAAAALLSGPVSDFYGRKNLLLLGLSVLAVSLLLHGVANGFYPLLVLRSIAGLGTGAITGLPSVLLSDTFERERQTSLISKSLCGYALGQTLGIPLGIALIDYIGFLQLNVLTGLLAGSLVLLALRQIPGPKRELDEEKAHGLALYFDQARQTFRSSAFVSLLLSSVASFFATSLFYVAFALWLYDEARLMPTQIAPMYVGAGLLQLFVLGFVLQRFNSVPSNMMAGGSFLLNAALFLLCIPALSSVASASLVFSLVLGSISLRIPAIQHIVNHAGPSRQKGLRMSLIQSCNHLGRALGAAVASLLYASVSVNGLILISALALLPCAALFTVSSRIRASAG